jgi:hypothetical protein
VADTTYIVLRDIDATGSPAWSWVADSKASTAERAIREVVQLVADGGGGTEGRYVAVPARSWKPVQVRTETTTVIRLDSPQEEA